MLSQEFITAGKAIFTITPSPAFAALNAGAKPHYTYKVTHKPAEGKWPVAYFVALLTGQDNENDYSYLGILDAATGHLRTTAKSAFAIDSAPVKLCRNVLAAIWAGRGAEVEAAGCQVNHEGRCGRCGRLLTTPESCAMGYGPECLKVMGKGVEIDEDEPALVG